MRGAVGPNMKLKASGGIKTFGTSSTAAIAEEIG